MVLYNGIPDKLMATVLLIFVIIGVSMLYIISIKSYIRYLEFCDYKNITPLNYFDWFVWGDNRL